MLDKNTVLSALLRSDKNERGGKPERRGSIMSEKTLDEEFSEILKTANKHDLQLLFELIQTEKKRVIQKAAEGRETG